jgi:PAS domain-containing protein
MQNASYMAIAADRPEPLDELQALIEFVQLASGASMVIAFEANEAGLAKSLAAAPHVLPQPFMLGESHIEQMRCSGGAASADSLRLPAPILLALGRPATKSLFIPTPVTEAPRSGVLLLWAGEGDCSLSLHSNVEQCIAKLAQLFGQILINRRSIVKRQLMTERFYDLFESVPSGIIVIGGDCGAALVNQPAAELLGIAAGEVEACLLAAPMRALRQSCINASVLQEAYGAVISDVDYALITLWDFGDRQFEVDTHPMKGDGRHGRIWLFHEISAQHRLEQELRGLAGTDPLTGLANRR